MASTFVCPCLRKIFIFYTLTLFTNLKLKRIMDKKELKFYEAPACEVVELNVVSTLLAGSTTEGVEDEGDITGGNGNITW